MTKDSLRVTFPELAELIENRPLPISREYAVEPHEHLKIVERNLQNLNDWVGELIRKITELAEKTEG